ncbi:Ku protein [Terrimonas rubra]|uniref:Non-homologous end joining protein Ku n=1 Tax=Terrimonas rubra TaxID=1035890 RepID=A0ABW6A803_9BACT
MKAIWTGAIGFGLVNIPVKMFSAIEESDLDLDMLDKKDLANIKYKRANENTGREVAWSSIVKGYKLDDRYIVVEDKDFEKARPEKSKTLTIDAFVKEEEIDSVYFETPYYLKPQKDGEAPFNLLTAALKKTGKVGMGTFVMRSKEVLGILRVYNDVLIFQRIRYAAEIRNTADLKIAKKRIKPGELKMAVSLVDQLTRKFDPAAYKNTYRAALMKIIRAKAKGKKMPVTKMKVVHSTARDLMSQLKASLSASKTKKAS